MKETNNGIMEISPNSITFRNANGVDSWTITFDSAQYSKVKNMFDHNKHSDLESLEFWDNFFEDNKIEYSEVKPR